MKPSALLVLLAAATVSAQTGPNDARARAIYKELVEINTTDTPAGNVTKAADAVAARLKAAGFADADVQVLGPDPRKGNLVARLRGTGAHRPLLLLAHLDVVEAKREDWSFDPFTFLEKDGFFYGRGTGDDKAMASQFVANMIRLKEEGFTPDRDLILALTADEEGGDFNGVEWLVKNHKGSHRRRFRDQRRGRRRQHAEGERTDEPGPGERKGVSGLPPRGHAILASQLAAGQGT
jgi:acetylornithine deacetylase/succinyl-diaminopimelate desuccinylase-like protein